ncbi:MAG: ornithine cyclodeaminase family protein [Actinobacteria bacterium]|nr:ornithine cyclodeaminase family protein [Actinomycetota bacterium]
MRVLTEEDVRACLPPWRELIDLAAEGLVALAEGRAEAPPKPAVHPSPGAFANAMPAAHPERNLLGCKWISIVPDNPVRGLPTANGVMVLNDAATGLPTCLMPAATLTAVRTAAVTGACVRALAGDGPITFLGAGVQARSHLPMLAALGRTEVTVWARRASALRELTAYAAQAAPGLTVTSASSREAAVRDAGTVVTGLSIGLVDTRLPVTLPRPDALLLPLDYASSVGPELAESAETLASDDVRQFEAVRSDRAKLGAYPRATTWTGHLLGHPRPPGRVVIANLGSGVSDLLVADAILRAAERDDVGQLVSL